MVDIRRPRRGSIAFRPRKRAKSQNAGFEAWPEVDEKVLLGFAGYKAGMLTAKWLETISLQSKTQTIEAVSGCTLIETPPLYAYGLRALTKNGHCIDVLTENKEILKMMNVKNIKEQKDKTESLYKNIDDIKEIRLLVFANPSLTGIGKKHIERMEIGVGGESIKDKVDYAFNFFGKEIRVFDVFKQGMYIDVSAVTKGKGIQGPIKRFGVTKQRRKATGKIRHVGTLGPFKPPYTMYTVPHAGQTGYHKRTELNKLILSIVPKEKIEEINPKGGFPHYGVIRNDALIVKGSVPGPIKRLIRMRRAIRKADKIVNDLNTTVII